MRELCCFLLTLIGSESHDRRRDRLPTLDRWIQPLLSGRAALSLLLGVAAATGFATAGEVVEPGAVIAGGVAWTDLDRMFSMEATVPPAARENVTAIALGNHLTAAANSDGSVTLFISDGGIDNIGEFIDGYISQWPAENVKSIQCDRKGHAYDEKVAVLKKDGSVAEFPWTRLPPGATTNGITAIAYSGGYLLCAMEDGRILRNGRVDPAWHDPVVPGGVTALATTYNLSDIIALRPDGSVVGWTEGVSHQLDLDIPAEARTNVVAISGGHEHWLTLKSDGSVVSWSLDGLGQTMVIPVPEEVQTGVTAISAGYDTSMALKTDGRVVRWNRSGSLLTADVWPGYRATAIADGVDHWVAVVEPKPPVLSNGPKDQTLRFGQDQSLLVEATGYPLFYQWRRDGVDLPDGTRADYPLKVAVSGDYTVVVSNDRGSITSSPPAKVVVAPPAPGTVVAWGSPGRGQTRVPPDALSDVVSFAAGRNFSIAQRADGRLVYWGSQEEDLTSRYAEIHGVTSLGSGPEASGLMLVGTTGLVLNDTTTYISPPSIWTNAIAAAVGDAFAMVLQRDGGVTGLGDWKLMTNVPSAARSGVIAIAAGYHHALALKDDGSVVAWGINEQGQTNVPPSALGQVVAIAAGVYHSLALRSDGSVVAWGDNHLGQSAVPPGAKTNVVAIAAGSFHSVALKSDGTVIAWGSGYEGQLNVPETIQGSVTAVAAGEGHTLALVGTAALQVQRTAEGLVLSWPARLPELRLQSTSDPGPGAIWNDLDQPPAVSGGRLSVSRPLEGMTRFYRLRR